MGLAAATKIFSCCLSLLCLLSVCLCSGIEDTYFICFNFTVKEFSSHGYEGQWSMNGLPFLQYSDKKAQPLGNLGTAVNDTKAWKDLTQSMKDIGEELRNTLLNMDPGPDKTRGNHILQGTMVSQYKQERLNVLCFAFTIDGQYSFYFYPTNKTWRATQPEAESILKALETKTELGNCLFKFGKGDLNYSIKVFFKLWKKMPRSTIEALDPTQPTSATQIPPTGNSTQGTTSTENLHTGNNTQSVRHVLIPVIVVMLTTCGGVSVLLIKKKGVPGCFPSSDLQSSSPAALGDSSTHSCGFSRKGNVFLMTSQKSVLVTLLGNHETGGCHSLMPQGIRVH